MCTPAHVQLQALLMQILCITVQSMLQHEPQLTTDCIYMYLLYFVCVCVDILNIK